MRVAHVVALTGKCWVAGQVCRVELWWWLALLALLAWPRKVLKLRECVATVDVEALE
jgi:hypothetical protein